MDYMAGRVCYKHNYAPLKKNRDFVVVTASVDHLEFYPYPLSVEKDFYIEVKLKM